MSPSSVLPFRSSAPPKPIVRRKRKCRRDASTHIVEMSQLKSFIETLRRWDRDLIENRHELSGIEHRGSAGAFNMTAARFTGAIGTKELFELYLTWLDGEDDEWGQCVPLDHDQLTYSQFGETLHLMGFKRQRTVDKATGKRPWVRKIPAAISRETTDIRVPVLERALLIEPEYQRAA